MISPIHFGDKQTTIIQALNNLIQSYNANELKQSAPSFTQRIVNSFQAIITEVNADGTYQFEQQTLCRTSTDPDADMTEWHRYGDEVGYAYPLDYKNIYFVGDIVEIANVLISGDIVGFVILTPQRFAIAKVISSALDGAETVKWVYQLRDQVKMTGYDWDDMSGATDFSARNLSEMAGNRTAATTTGEYVEYHKEPSAAGAIEFWFDKCCSGSGEEPCSECDGTGDITAVWEYTSYSAPLGCDACPASTSGVAVLHKASATHWTGDGTGMNQMEVYCSGGKWVVDVTMVLAGDPPAPAHDCGNVDIDVDLTCVNNYPSGTTTLEMYGADVPIACGLLTITITSEAFQ
jgi:hypothetical protein